MTINKPTKTVIIRDELGSNSLFGYNAREVYEVVEVESLYYKVVEPQDKFGFIIIRDHCKEINITYE